MFIKIITRDYCLGHMGGGVLKIKSGFLKID